MKQNKTELLKKSFTLLSNKTKSKNFLAVKNDIL